MWAILQSGGSSRIQQPIFKLCGVQPAMTWPSFEYWHFSLFSAPKCSLEIWLRKFIAHWIVDNHPLTNWIPFGASFILCSSYWTFLFIIDGVWWFSPAHRALFCMSCLSFWLFLKGACAVALDLITMIKPILNEVELCVTVLASIKVKNSLSSTLKVRFGD